MAAEQVRGRPLPWTDWRLPPVQPDHWDALETIAIPAPWWRRLLNRLRLH